MGKEYVMDESALFKLTHGLYVLGAVEGNGRLCGSVVDAVMQVANKPLVIALSCHNNSYTKSVIEQSGKFSLSVLCKNVEPFVVANFGFQSSRDVEKWGNVDYNIKDGLPYLKQNLAEISAKVLQTIAYDSNTLFLAEVIDSSNTDCGEPLTYNNYRDYFKNDVIKSFNDFKQQKEKEKAMAEDTKKKWVCTVCQYVYDGDVPFEDLPDDYVCPVCGVGKDMFEQQ